MKFLPLGLTVPCALLVCGTAIGFGQSPEQAGSDAVRVTVSMHPDGSRTVYKFERRENAKPSQPRPIRMANSVRRFVTSWMTPGVFRPDESSGPDGKFRFKSRYKYDGAGRLEEETQNAQGRTAAQDRLQLRIKIRKTNRLFHFR